MRFSLSVLFLVMIIAALSVALYSAHQRPDVLRIGDYVNTWEMEKLIVGHSKWPDKSISPDLMCTDAYSIGFSVCRKLDGKVGTTGAIDWEVVAISLEKTQFTSRDHWVYIVRLEAPHFPNSPALREPERLALMVLMDRSIVFDFKNCSNELSQAMKESLASLKDSGFVE